MKQSYLDGLRLSYHRNVENTSISPFDYYEKREWDARVFRCGTGVIAAACFRESAAITYEKTGSVLLPFIGYYYGIFHIAHAMLHMEYTAPLDSLHGLSHGQLRNLIRNKLIDRGLLDPSFIDVFEKYKSLRELANYTFHTHSISWKDLLANTYDETGIAFDLAFGFIREISDALGNRGDLGPIIDYITGRITETLTDDLMPLYLSSSDEKRVTAYLREKKFTL